MIRVKFWIYSCPCFVVQSELREQFAITEETKNIYQYIQQQIKLQNELEDKSNNILNERVKDEISRDLKRTFTAE